MPISCMNPSQAISIRLAGTGLNCPVERIGRLCAAVAGGIGLDVLQRRKPLLEPDFLSFCKGKVLVGIALATCAGS